MIDYIAYESRKHEDVALHKEPMSRTDAKETAKAHTAKTGDPTRVKGPCGGHPNTCVWESTWEKDKK